MESKSLERMKELTVILKNASRAYYQDASEIMSNYEYDALYDELAELEKETGVILAGSPTQTVGYEVQSELPKRTHPSPMLSLDKTKEREALAQWLGDREGVMSWKMDGLTVVLTYENGELTDAVTRGNGEVGEVITANAKTFVNVPLRIPFEGRLVLRGEAVIGYRDFEAINRTIADADARYKNPRNLCSGSVRQLDSKITAQRNVRFFAFALIEVQGRSFTMIADQFGWLKELGFETVEYIVVPEGEKVPATVQIFADKIAAMEYPSDGLVLCYNDIAYGLSLGLTARFPRNAIAFKWADETAETVLREIEWSASRTGLINPVAIFDPVELEGTTVSRASVHNVSIVEQMQLGVGDTITVYKANMIIPQIAENLTRSGQMVIPDTCPVCGGATGIRQEADVRTLYCTNPDCQAKHIKKYALMAERDALNIEGLSEMTLEKFVGEGMIHEYRDVFGLRNHRETIVNMEGFGVKSFDNLMDSLEKARKTTMAKFLYTLGIPGVGLSYAKVICRNFPGEDCYEKIKKAEPEELTAIEGIGPVLARAVRDYFDDEKKREEADRLFECLIVEMPKNAADKKAGEALPLAGMTFVITGSLKNFENRSLMKEYIESLGGKAADSVTSKTTALINNDITSGSGKNKKAKELGVEIITEEEFLRRAKHAD